MPTDPTGQGGAGPTPVACTLEAAAVPDRLAAWRGLLDRAHSQHTGDDGALHITFSDPAVVEDVARLVALEHACCAFFSFVINVDADGVRLEVRAPAGAEVIVGQLFGAST